MDACHQAHGNPEMKQFQRIVGYAISLGGAAVILSQLL
jgi:hypothetical protein